MKTLVKDRGVLQATPPMIKGEGHLPHESKQTGTVWNTGQVLGVSRTKDATAFGDNKTSPKLASEAVHQPPEGGGEAHQEGPCCRCRQETVGSSYSLELGGWSCHA